MEYYLTKEELYHSLIQSQKYGIPEQKKFPLFDLDHVKSAIKFFNYVDPKYEDQLAKAILRRAKEYGLDLSEMSIGDNNRFKKYLPNDELKHHGILGQKWGIRRYQNEDGSYTEAGKARRAKDFAKAAKDSAKYSNNLRKSARAHQKMSQIGRSFYTDLSDNDKRVLRNSAKATSDLNRLDDKIRAKMRSEGRSTPNESEIKRMNAALEKAETYDAESRKVALKMSAQFLEGYSDMKITNIIGNRKINSKANEYLATFMENAAAQEYALDSRTKKELRDQYRKANKRYKKALKSGDLYETGEIRDIAKMEYDEYLENYNKKYR